MYQKQFNSILQRPEEISQCIVYMYQFQTSKLHTKTTYKNESITIQHDIYAKYRDANLNNFGHYLACSILSLWINSNICICTKIKKMLCIYYVLNYIRVFYVIYVKSHVIESADFFLNVWGTDGTWWLIPKWHSLRKCVLELEISRQTPENNTIVYDEDDRRWNFL